MQVYEYLCNSCITVAHYADVASITVGTHYINVLFYSIL